MYYVHVCYVLFTLFVWFLQVLASLKNQIEQLAASQKDFPELLMAAQQCLLARESSLKAQGLFSLAAQCFVYFIVTVICSNALVLFDPAVMCYLHSGNVYILS